MERGQKKVKIDTIRSRKNEVRSLLKSCFGNILFSLVPFEIWRDLIVSNADLKTITLLSQTCFAFKEIVDIIGENNFNLALMLRREGQIDLAKKYLLLCAENNNSIAMFHVGYAYRFGGWGLEMDDVKGVEWLKKSAELGNGYAMVFVSECFRYGIGIDVNEELSDVWAKKALSSNNSFAVGYCHDSRLGTERDDDKAFLCFEASAKYGDEFGQYYLGICFRNGYGTQMNHEKAFYWMLISAEQGNCAAQYFVCDMYHFGEGCEKDKEKAIIWYKKAAKQGYKYGVMALKERDLKL